MAPMGRAECLNGRRAQIVEISVMMVLVAWAAWVTNSYLSTRGDEAAPRNDPQSTQAMVLNLLPLLLQWLVITAIAVAAWALLARHEVPLAMQLSSRQERDAGLVLGCVLPPVVLIGRFLVQVHESNEYSPVTILYAWASISIAWSIMLKLVLLRSAGVLATLVVDAMLLPVFFSFITIEAGHRFIAPTLGRCLVALVFHFGRRALPRSFTIGEALIVAQGLGICVVNIILVTACKMDSSAVKAILSPWQVTDLHLYSSENQLALQIGLVGALFTCVALSPLLSAYGSPSPHIINPPLSLFASTQFVITVIAVGGLIIYPWSCFLLDTWNPVLWLLNFLTDTADRVIRWQLIPYWLICLAMLVPAIAIISQRLALRQIIARKLFHLLVVVMFAPAFFGSAAMLSLSYGVAVAVFALVECIRAVSLPPIGSAIATYVKPFIDHREGGRVILTHTYLLLGCALPLWLSYSVEKHNAFAANAGVLALGVGDAMGAVVGSLAGRRKIFGHKTWEGTAAVFISIMLASLVFHDFVPRVLDGGSPTQLILVVFGVLLTSLLEAATAQIDNLVLSLVLFTVANLVACHRQE